MLAKKNSFLTVILFIAFIWVVAGCTPPGPRALLKGKHFLDQGDYADAVTELQTATTLLPTNAAAWNYYGVALQGAGRLDEAAAAYETALKFNRDLVEAHFNLGNVSLEQNKADMARTEFTAYVLHRPNDVAGWLKLGSAQLKLKDAEAGRSFSTAHYIDTNSAEALNGLGLTCIQAGNAPDAVRFFAAAVNMRADFAPAILNLATVDQEYLHDNKAALESYRAYLALKTRPPNWDEVNALANSLEEQTETKIAAAPPAMEVKTQPRVSNVVTQRTVVMARPPTVTRVVSANPPAVKPMPVQYVEVRPAPPIVATPRTGSPAVAAAPVQAQVPLDATMQMQAPTQLEAAPDEPKKGFWGKLFSGQPGDEAGASSKYLGEGLTPLPGSGEAEPATKPVVVPAAKPLEVVAPAPIFARYNYFSPRRPVAGDRAMASGAFNEARLFEQDERWPDALQSYQQAASLDPSWYEAQYNTGVIAYRLRNYAVALPRYEMALALQPDSADARYNFALALKAAGYVPDASEQLRIILAAHPDEVRAHLALANICAQLLRDPAQAREHYLKVLELDPENEQKADIRFWLSGNPPGQ